MGNENTIPDEIMWCSEDNPYRKKSVSSEKTTFSVPEMRRMLGLGKTESYWLIHKHFFDVVTVNGKMRVVRSSFEHWYSMQIKYHKVDGSLPGAALNAMSYSVRDIAQLIHISESSVYDLIKRENIKTFLADSWMRVSKEEFERWYGSQHRYRTDEDRERDAQMEQDSVSMPQMAWLLGISRKMVYAILQAKENRGLFRYIEIAGRKRITKESMERWLKGQDTYHILTDEEREARKAAAEKENEILREPQNPNFYTIEEIGTFFGIHRSSVYRWIRNGDIPGRRIGNVWRIPRVEFDEWLACRNS